MEFLRKERKSSSSESASALIRDNPDVYNEMDYIFVKTFFRNKWVLKYVILLKGNVYVFDREDSRKYLEKFSLTGYSNVVEFEGKGKSLALRIESRNPKLEKRYFAVTNEGNRIKLKEALNTEIENANYSRDNDLKTLNYARTSESSELQRRLELNAFEMNTAIPITSTDEFQNTQVNMSGDGRADTPNYVDLPPPEGAGNESEIIETPDYDTINSEEEIYLTVEGSDAGSQEGDDDDGQTLNSPMAIANSNYSVTDNKVNGSDSSSAYAIIEIARSMRKTQQETTTETINNGEVYSGPNSTISTVTSDKNNMDGTTASTSKTKFVEKEHCFERIHSKSSSDITQILFEDVNENLYANVNSACVSNEVENHSRPNHDCSSTKLIREDPNTEGTNTSHKSEDPCYIDTKSNSKEQNGKYGKDTDSPREDFACLERSDNTTNAHSFATYVPEDNIRDGTRTMPENIPASRSEMIYSTQNGYIGYSPELHNPILYEGSDNQTDSSISRYGSSETLSSDGTTDYKWSPAYLDN